MTTATRFLSCFALLTGAIPMGLAAQESAALNYPPADQPLYLECRMHDAGEPPPRYEELLPVVMYFPDGIKGGFLQIEFVDPHNQLEGGKFGFSIQATEHWSLIDSEGVPTPEESSLLPQIMFLAPEGPANFRILYAKEAEMIRTGICLGMIGPNTTSAFAKAKADPSSLDR